VFKTFNQWSSEGFKISKGSKATWINNIAHFSDKQVLYVGLQTLKPPRWMLNSNMNYDTDYDQNGWVEAFDGADGWGRNY
jgi:hypothetical protein